MRHFLETSFRPAELKVMNHALEDWRLIYGVPEGSPDLEIAAAVILNAFREGHRDLKSLQTALVGHKGLNELTSSAAVATTPSGNMPSNP